MGMSWFVGTPFSLAERRHRRRVIAFGKVERKQREWVKSQRRYPGDFLKLCGESEVEYPWPTDAEIEALPLPVVVDGPLTCSGCGTVSARQKHYEGSTITQCSSCRGEAPTMRGRRGRGLPAQVVEGGGAHAAYKGGIDHSAIGDAILQVPPPKGKP